MGRWSGDRRRGIKSKGKCGAREEVEMGRKNKLKGEEQVIFSEKGLSLEGNVPGEGED